MKKYVDQKGSALVYVVILMAVLFILGTSLLNKGLAENKLTIYQENHTEAYYLARSGADAIAYYIISNPLQADILKLVSTPPSNNELGNGSFQVAIQEESNGDLTLNSVGLATDGTTANVTLQLHKLTTKEIFKHAVFSNNNLDITGLSSVIGDVGSNGTIISDSHTTRGAGDKNYPNLGTTYTLDTFPILSSVGNLNVNNSDKLINASGKYGTFNFTGNNDTLTFDTTAGDLQIIADTLYIKGNIVIQGSHTLSIYINDSANFQIPRLINSASDPNKLLLFLEDGCELSFAANIEFTGYIYGPKATVKEWSGSKITGGIIADTFAANGNPTLTYIEPDVTTDISGSVRVYQKGQWKD